MVSKKVVDHDFKKISGNKEGEMRYGNFSESIGGNASYHQEGGKTFPCDARNFFYDTKSGEIEYFGNWQHVPDKIIDQYSEGTIRRALDFDKGKDGIVSIKVHPQTSKEAAETLIAAAKLYNDKKGWKGKITVEGNTPRNIQKEGWLERMFRKLASKKTASVIGAIILIIGILFSFYPTMTGFSVLKIQNTSNIISGGFILFGIALLLFVIFGKNKSKTL
jgi:hypothetical protein